jgi:hypothetical protein
MGGKATDDRYSEQETERARVTGCGRITGCARRLPLIAASIALLLVLAGCSSSSSSDHYAADVYPSQPLAEILFKDTLNSPPPVRTAGSPAQPNLPTAVAGTVASGPGTAAPSGSATAAAAVPAPSASSEDFDRASASAYPSVPLSDILLSPTKPAAR